MKILIYLTGGVHWLGGVQYTRNLLKAVTLLPEAERPDIVLHIGHKNAGHGYEEEFSAYPNVVIDGPSQVNVRWSHLVLTALRRVKRLYGGDLPLARFRSDDCQVAFPVKGPGVAGPGQKVYWVPDFQYKHYPEYFSDQERTERDAMYRRMFAEPGLLVLSSEAVRTDFLRFFPDLHEKPVRILRFTSVMDDADYSADPAAACAGLGLPEKFIYLPNQMWQHKGFDTAFRALGILRKQGLAPSLVCTGNALDYRNNKYFDELQGIIAEQGLGGQIVLLGMLPRATQLQIYRRAALTLQPSRFEGWSTSVEDARALGRPILLSDIDVHREQAPADATYFRVDDDADLAGKLASLWADLPPVPDIEREKRARQEGAARSLAYARAFISIAAEAAKSRASEQPGYRR